MVAETKRDELRLLIVSSGVNRYGIATDQIASLKNADTVDTVDTAEPAVSLEQLLGTSALAAGHYAKILLIKQSTKTPILISEPEQIATCNVRDIRKLPDILTVSAEKKGVWGLLPQDCGLIILIDFYKNQLFRQLADSIANNSR